MLMDGHSWQGSMRLFMKNIDEKKKKISDHFRNVSLGLGWQPQIMQISRTVRFLLEHRYHDTYPSQKDLYTSTKFNEILMRDSNLICIHLQELFLKQLIFMWYITNHRKYKHFVNCNYGSSTTLFLKAQYFGSITLEWPPWLYFNSVLNTYNYINNCLHFFNSSKSFQICISRK